MRVLPLNPLTANTIELIDDAENACLRRSDVLSFQEKALTLPLSFADRTLEGQCTVAAT